MTTNHTPSPADPSSAPPLLVAEREDCHDLSGLDVVRTDTGEVESFIAFSRNEVDFMGLVESREKAYEGTEWHTRRVWRTHVDPAHMRAALDQMNTYVTAVEKIHRMYSEVVMDTPEDQALHQKVVAAAEDTLGLVKSALGIVTDEADDSTQPLT